MKRWPWQKRPSVPSLPPDAGPVRLTGEDYEKLRIIMEIVNERSQPNINHLREIVGNIRLLNLNVKALGYELARQLSAALPPAQPSATPRFVGLSSKLSTQSDIESNWLAGWCSELHIPILYHRKLWELAYVLQAIHEAGHLRPGARGLGFGCGTEPLPSYFARTGVAVTATDQHPEGAREAGWVATGQHAIGADALFQPHLVDRATFDRNVRFSFADMNAVPGELRDFDFCWSVCALEHLGSIDAGLAFIERSLETLRPGGTAVHTTEFNIDPGGPTIDNWPSVLFQRKHIEAFAQRLEVDGHRVAPLDFDPGNKPLDRFIDMPPWYHDLPTSYRSWLGQEAHLKVASDGFVATCIGLIVTKAA